MLFPRLLLRFERGCLPELRQSPTPMCCLTDQGARISPPSSPHTQQVASSGRWRENLLQACLPAGRCLACGSITPISAFTFTLCFPRVCLCAHVVPFL